MYNDPELERQLKRLNRDALERVVKDGLTAHEAVETSAEVLNNSQVIDAEIGPALRADAEWLLEQQHDDEWNFRKMLEDDGDDEREFCSECGVLLREVDGETLCTSRCPRDPYYYGDDDPRVSDSGGTSESR
ncbi:hypothetical protein C482_08993 [Natrialba chahannaoensis JCM 10990]|uniref:Uncharacterized protein n=1 Tax=Natrialba chahannaoensis JCM 10990 TaxID=1227492 RepID=M0APC7_9EURY|nr:hypothetical protein [Natrialba chahannaoensis]ELZ00182.1 hypothetical protein C482_08993 [Natrialba chahannaoensis JCM 10990]